MNFKELCNLAKNSLGYADNWTKRHNELVKNYIDEAVNHSDINWDDSKLEEFLGEDNGVSSLSQGRPKTEYIKKRWKELCPLLSQIAKADDKFQYKLYERLEKKIFKILNELGYKNRFYAYAHRIVAGLQPKIFSTVINEKDIIALFNVLKNRYKFSIPNISGDWYTDSYALFNMVQKEFPNDDPLSQISIPWALYVYICKNDGYGENMSELINIIENHYNIVLNGAPGTGKSYLALQLAQEIISKNNKTNNKKFIEFVQFHPSYDYTDFVEGLKPKLNDETSCASISFERRDGIFKSLCERAIKDTENKYVLIIDEINRGDVSRIFGELFFSIDPDYRVNPNGENINTITYVKTQYQNLIQENNAFYNGFYVPNNVYIIGTMNDIDRSVESLDFALRRRFVFIEITAKQSESMLDTLDSNLRDICIKKMEALNKKILTIDGLNSAYHIGAAYFLKINKYEHEDNESKFTSLWDYHLKPLLLEYLRGCSDIEEKIEQLKAAYNN